MRRTPRYLASAALVLGVSSSAVPAGSREAPPATIDFKSIRDCAQCPELVAIPAGRFVMGVAPGEEDRERLAEPFRNRSEPQRTVDVSGFLAGKYEVSRAQFEAFAAATGHAARGCFVWRSAGFEYDAAKSWLDPGYAQQPSHPATCISWDDARAYVRWLSELTRNRYRLLSEAEWEYAARASTSTPRFWDEVTSASCAYSNAADRSSRAEIAAAADWPGFDCDDGYAYTAPVGRFKPNGFGLHDMLGNVAEWTEDCWNATYAEAPADARPRTSGDCFLRAVRGGSWEDGSVGLRAAYRVGSPRVIRVNTRGFRVARDP